MHEQGSDDLLICGLMEFPLIRLAETQVKDRRGKKEATCVYSTHLGHTYLISSSEHTPKQKKHVHSETTDLRDSERHFWWSLRRSREVRPTSGKNIDTRGVDRYLPLASRQVMCAQYLRPEVFS